MVSGTAGYSPPRSAELSTAGKRAANRAPPNPRRDPAPADYNQRSLEIYEFKRVGDQRRERGKEIYYYKCWFCHNDFAEGAPKLTGVYQRGTLDDRTARDSTTASRNRSAKAAPGMASYKYTLSETDIEDLVTFIREGLLLEG